MTDNEKRAHDIAIASMNAIVISESVKASSSGGRANFDFYKMYKSQYDSALKLIESDFPSAGRS